MSDMKDIEPNCWRAECEIPSENTVRTIISSFFQLQSCLSIYVSNEDMEKITYAKEAFESKQMDLDEILVIIQEARQKAEERQAIKKRSLEDLQQTLSRVLATTESWPLTLKSGITKRCETEQRWLDSMCDKATGGQTAGEITTRIKKEVEDIEDHIKNLNEYFEFTKKKAKLPEERLNDCFVFAENSAKLPEERLNDCFVFAENSAKLPEEPTHVPHFHVHWRASKSDWMCGMTPIAIYDTHDWVFGKSRVRTAKCEKSDCASIGKPHSHEFDDSECDVEGSYYLLLCHDSNCELRHAHPQYSDDCWIFDLFCNQYCDCMKQKKRPSYMPKKAEVFEHPIPA